MVAATDYVSGPPSPTFNDKIVAITHDSIFSVVNRQIIRILAGIDPSTGLGKYYEVNDKKYPPDGANLQAEMLPHIETPTNNALIDNHWYDLVSYSVAADRKKVTLTISAPPSVVCTITPGKPGELGELLCPYP